MTPTAFATLTSKGQLTLPKAIRDALGLHEGDQVRFELDLANVKTVMQPVRYHPEDLASFAVAGAKRMSFAEMKAAKRDGALP